MKVLALFTLFLAMATSYPVVKTWTLSSLSEAMVTFKGDPSMKPYLDDALNEIMLALFTGKNENLVQAVLPSPTGGAKWTLEQLTAALEDPETKPEYSTALFQAYKFIQLKNATGNLQESIIEVVIPAMDISTWTRSDLNEALMSPSTNKDLMPYLLKAQTKLQEALEKGETQETIYIVTPVGFVTPKADYEFLLKPSKHVVKKTKKGI